MHIRNVISTSIWNNKIRQLFKWLNQFKNMVNEVLDMVNRYVKHCNSLIIYSTLLITNLDRIKLDFQVSKSMCN
jgi:hypothetical protein